MEASSLIQSLIYSDMEIKSKNVVKRITVNNFVGTLLSYFTALVLWSLVINIERL